MVIPFAQFGTKRRLVTIVLGGTWNALVLFVDICFVHVSQQLHCVQLPGKGCEVQSRRSRGQSNIHGNILSKIRKITVKKERIWTKTSWSAYVVFARQDAWSWIPFCHLFGPHSKQFNLSSSEYSGIGYVTNLKDNSFAATHHHPKWKAGWSVNPKAKGLVQPEHAGAPVPFPLFLKGPEWKYDSADLVEQGDEDVVVAHHGGGVEGRHGDDLVRHQLVQHLQSRWNNSHGWVVNVCFQILKQEKRQRNTFLRDYKHQSVFVFFVLFCFVFLVFFFCWWQGEFFVVQNSPAGALNFKFWFTNIVFQKGRNQNYTKEIKPNQTKTPKSRGFLSSECIKKFRDLQSSQRNQR